jgi:hypothetical protein
MIKSFKLFEKKSDLQFIKLPRKEGNKTDVYKVLKNDIEIGRIKWSSRVMGYAFLPMEECDLEIKTFIKKLMSDRK